MVFNKLEADTATKNYEWIRTQIGSWASPQIDAAAVKSDTHIGVSLFEGDT